MSAVLLLIAVLAAAAVAASLLLSSWWTTGRAGNSGTGTWVHLWRGGWSRLSGSRAQQATDLFAAADAADAAGATHDAPEPDLTDPPLPRPRWSQPVQPPQPSQSLHAAQPSGRPEVILPRPRHAMDDQDLRRNPRTR